MNMMFSKPRTIKRQSNQQIQSMNFINKQTIYPVKIIPQPAPSQETSSALPPKKKMIWGEPTWFFLHTMAQKIKPEHFHTVRQGLLQQINAICRNLPCPDCSAHAGHYLDNSNFNAIQTKDQLITFLYDFHNSVNLRKNIPLFPKSELMAKYSAANTANIIQYFLIRFADKSASIKMIANDMYRKRVLLSIKDWLMQNLEYFEA
jgi:hypothetical protein